MSPSDWPASTPAVSVSGALLRLGVPQSWGTVCGTALLGDRVTFVSVQPRDNLLFRQNERELFPLCAEDGVAVIPYNPLAGGFLTGKHSHGSPTEGTRFTLGFATERYQDRYRHHHMFDIVDVMT